MAVAQHALASKLLLNEDKLLQFVAHLRANDFTIGSDQVINLFDLLLAYSTQQKLPENLADYASLIAPIVCQNQADQQRFGNIWHRWLKQNGLLAEEGLVKGKRKGADNKNIDASPDELSRRTRFWPFLLLGLYLATAFWVLSPYIDYFLTYDDRKPIITPWTSAGDKPKDEQSPTSTPPDPQQQAKNKLDKILSFGVPELTGIDKGFGKGETMLDISADGKYLLTGDKNDIGLRLRETGEQRKRFIKPDYSKAHFSNGANYVVIYDKAGRVDIWSILHNRKVYSSESPVRAIDFSQNDEKVILVTLKEYIVLALDTPDVKTEYKEKSSPQNYGGIQINSISIYKNSNSQGKDSVLIAGEFNSKQGIIKVASIDQKLTSDNILKTPVTTAKFFPDGSGLISYGGNVLSAWQLPKNSNFNDLKSLINDNIRINIERNRRRSKNFLTNLTPVTINLQTTNNKKFRFLNKDNVLYDHGGQCKQIPQYAKATNYGRARTLQEAWPPCRSGQFFDPNGSCYSCPQGYKRSAASVNSEKACVINTETDCSGPGMALWHIPTRQIYDLTDKLGIPADKLATAANSGRFLSYLAEKKLLPLEQQTLWQRPQARYAVPAIPAILLAIWVLWSYRRRRLWLQRRTAAGSPQLEKLNVTYDDHGLWQNESLKRGLQQLRRYHYQPTRRLNVAASVEATVRQGGFFQSVFSHRPVQPEYLLLIDQLHVRDFQRLLIDAWVKRLRDEGLHVSAWYFYQDLRVCYAEKGNTSATIDELAARYENYRLLVVSDVEGLFNPLSSKPVSWLSTLKTWRDRAVMTPRATELWGHREAVLNKEGFAIVPVDEAGFEVLGDYFATEHDNRVSGAPVLRPCNVIPLPPTILRNAERWLRDTQPSEKDINNLVQELQAYLGEEAYLLLCASAVYPVLDWNMTLYLDQVLSNQSDSLEPRHQKLLRLARLPWFRHGNMPDYLRLVFIHSMSRQQERLVRNAIQALLKSALTPSGKGFSLEFAVGSKQKSRRWLRDFLRTIPQEEVMHDYIFISMMRGKGTGKLSMALPLMLNKLFPRKAADIKRIFFFIAMLAAGATLVALWSYWPTLFPVPYSAKIETTELKAKDTGLVDKDVAIDPNTASSVITVKKDGLKNKYEEGVRSLSSNTITSLEFRNKLDEAVVVYWIDFNGREVKYKILESGASYLQSTYVTHPWVIRRQSDFAQVAFTVAKKGKQVLVINKGGVSKESDAKSNVTPGLNRGQQQRSDILGTNIPVGTPEKPVRLNAEEVKTLITEKIERGKIVKPSHAEFEGLPGALYSAYYFKNGEMLYLRSASGAPPDKWEWYIKNGNLCRGPKSVKNRSCRAVESIGQNRYRSVGYNTGNIRNEFTIEYGTPKDIDKDPMIASTRNTVPLQKPPSVDKSNIKQKAGSTEKTLVESNFSLELMKNGIFEKGFEAEYSLTRSGIYMGEVKSNLSLSQSGNYLYQSEAIPRGLVSMFIDDKITQTSEFIMDRYNINPLSFREEHTSKKKEGYNLTFDWKNKRIQNNFNNQTYEIPASGIQDLLSFQLQIMGTLYKENETTWRQKSTLSSKRILVAARKGLNAFMISVYDYIVIETEKGNFKALGLEFIGRDKKRYLIWFAEKLHFLPVKIVKTDEKDTITELVLKEVKELGALRLSRSKAR